MLRDDMKRLFSAGYRIFFLLAGVFAVVTMIVWEGWLAIHATGGMVTGEPFAMAPHLWHGHELIFGYGSAAVALPFNLRREGVGKTWGSCGCSLVGSG